MSSPRGLSPVVASIILIAVTVAVSISVAVWMGSLTFSSKMKHQNLVVAVPSFENATYAHAWIDGATTSKLADTNQPESLPFNMTISTDYDTATLKVEYYFYVPINNYTYQMKQIGYQEYILNLTKAEVSP